MNHHHRRAAASSATICPWSKRLNFKNLFTADNGGCGCGLKPTDVIEPKPKPKPKSKPTRCPSSSVSSCPAGQRSATTYIDNSPGCKTVSPCPKLRDSVAVVKDSHDPYRDFRQSMLQMILEREIYGIDDLQKLLECFLDLNSPHHHETIVRAFVEIWDDDGEETTPPCSPASGPE